MMAFLAISALSLGSCSQSEDFLNEGDLNNGTETPVKFSTYLGRAVQSRAGVMDIDGLKSNGFGVFAYYTGQDLFTPNNGFTPNFMYNQEVTWQATGDEDGSWAYTPVKYWPNTFGDKVSFFAYAPYTDVNDPETGTTGNEYNIISFTGNNDANAGYPKVTFKVHPDVKQQVDLLYNKGNLAQNITKQSINEKIRFEFDHALARVGFKALLEIDGNSGQVDGLTDTPDNAGVIASGSKVTINTIKFESDEMPTQATLNLGFGSIHSMDMWDWENASSGHSEYIMQAENFIEGSNEFTNESPSVASRAGETEGEEAKTNPNVHLLTADDSYLMLIPTLVDEAGNSVEKPVTITVNYTVETSDSKLSGGKSSITTEAKTTFNLALKAGMSHNLVLHIGLTSVKVDAMVEKWVEGDDFGVSANDNYETTLTLRAEHSNFRNTNPADKNYGTFIDGPATLSIPMVKVAEGTDQERYIATIPDLQPTPYLVDPKNMIHYYDEDESATGRLIGWAYFPNPDQKVIVGDDGHESSIYDVIRRTIEAWNDDEAYMKENPEQFGGETNPIKYVIKTCFGGEFYEVGDKVTVMKGENKELYSCWIYLGGNKE